MITLENVQGIFEFISVWGLKVVGGIAVLIVGIIAGRLSRKGVRLALSHARLDETLVSILGNMTYYMVLSMVAIAVLGAVGIQTASLITVLGAASLAIGLALQGSLSNFASGVMLFLFRPFRVSDYIEVGDHAGNVAEVGVFSTLLDTLDNVRIVIPNSYIAEHPIQNWSTNGIRRLDLEIEIAVDSDLPRAREAIRDLQAEGKTVIAVARENLIGGLISPSRLSSGNSTGASSAASLAAIIAAPWATCSSTFSAVKGSRTIRATISRTIGILVEPPTSTTRSMSSASRFANFSASRTGFSVRSRRGRIKSLNCSRFISELNFIIANNKIACIAAEIKAKEIGYKPIITTTSLTGEAKEVGKYLIEKISKTNDRSVYISGGETTVTVKGHGKGGRNQEMILGSIKSLDGRDIVFSSFATDGIDGESKASGAIADGFSLMRAYKKNLDIEEYLEDNNSFEFFNKLGDLFITGKTGINVMDIQIIIS